MALPPTGTVVLAAKTSPESWNGGTGYPHLGTGTQPGTGLGPEKVPFSRQVKVILEIRSPFMTYK
jgi:hypothetical protein